MNNITLPAKAKVAAFDVDCQKTFTPICPEELPVPEGDEIVDELNHQAQFAGYRIGSKDAHSPQAIWVANKQQPTLSKLSYAQADTAWPVHAVPATKGFELLDGLPQVMEYDYFVWKGVEPHVHPYGACYHDLYNRVSTGVIEFLMAKGVNIVLVGGLATDYCVRATCLQLLDAGFDLVLNQSATRGISTEDCDRTFQDILSNGGEIIENTDLLTSK